MSLPEGFTLFFRMLFHTRPHACAHFFGARGSKSRAAGTVLDRELGLLLRTYLVLLFTSSLAQPLSVVGDKDDSSERLPHSPEFFTSAGSSPFRYIIHIPIRYPGCLLPAAVITMIWTTTITRTTRGSGDITCPFSRWWLYVPPTKGRRVIAYRLSR